MSVSILVDYNNIVKNNNLLLLENRIASPPQTEFSIGLVIVIKKEQYETLKSIPKGYKRIKYMNSIPFVSNISGYEYFTYDKNKKICEVFDIKDYEAFYTIIKNINNKINIKIHIVSISNYKPENTYDYLHIHTLNDNKIPIEEWTPFWNDFNWDIIIK